MTDPLTDVKGFMFSMDPFLMVLSQAPGIINLTAPDEVQCLAGLLSPDLIRQAFSLTGTVTLRRRKPPPRPWAGWLSVWPFLQATVTYLMDIVDRTGRPFTAPGSVIARR